MTIFITLLAADGAFIGSTPDYVIGRGKVSAKIPVNRANSMRGALAVVQLESGIVLTAPLTSPLQGKVYPGDTVVVNLTAETFLA